MPSGRTFTVLPALPDSLKQLDVIARNMFWSWNPEFVELFRRIDSNLWYACGHNPVRMLGSVSQRKLEELAKNQGFLCELQRADEKLKSYIEQPGWFEKNQPESINPVIAYFSAEFGIHECLPIYSGGLGILAGDHLKSASDLGIPLVGVGLLYQKGYFRQYLNIDGWQQEVYAENDFYNLPLKLVHTEKGQPLTVSIQFPDAVVQAQVWCVTVGRIKLYLLDTNIDANSARERDITANLYGGDREVRIRQEILLGIGGLRALLAMGINPTVCHMNEGHAAFMATERIRQLTSSGDMTFDQALEATRPGNVFTLHTPVKAGNDEFPKDMMQKYFQQYITELGINEEQFLGLGKVNPQNDRESFKMPVLALKMSAYKNAVSRLHGQVSRKMWQQLWPGIPIPEVPIISITNGVHIQSWLSDEMLRLYDRYLGPNWSQQLTDNQMWKNISQIPDEELWRTHQVCKSRLVAFARKRLKAQMQRRGTYHTELNWADEVLDPEALTIGFARRFATYKRGNLLLTKPKRLIKLLSEHQKPVQIIFAGKAHPRDSQGKEIIRQIIHFANQYNVRRRIVFLEDYDINVARLLVRGVDVWLNNPRRPMEASGTSGMKAAINGALNMSTLDGWWCEGFRPQAGWAIGSGETYDDPSYQDMVESQAIYNILENEVVPLFYTRSADGLPRAWIHRMKNSIKWITPHFNTHRMVDEYTQSFYNPAVRRWQYMNEQECSRAKAFSEWKSNIKSNWPKFSIKDVQVRINNNGQETELTFLRNSQLKVGSELSVRTLVNLGKIDPKDVSVELYHGPVDSWGDVIDGSVVRMDYQAPAQQNGEHWFTGTVRWKTAGRQGLTARILPRHDDLNSPYDLGLILWENKT